MISPTAGMPGAVQHAHVPSHCAESRPGSPKPEGCSDHSSMQGDAMKRSSQTAAPSGSSPIQADLKELVGDLEKLVKDMLGDAQSGDNAGNADSGQAADANNAAPDQNSSTQQSDHNSSAIPNTTPNTTPNTNQATNQQHGSPGTFSQPGDGGTSQNSSGDTTGQTATGSGLPNGAKNGDAIGGGSTAVQDMESKGSAWWYNWTPSSGNLQAPNDAQFVPMIWGEKDLTQSNLDAVKSSSSPYLLGFNEPDHPDQANMTVAQAIDAWPKLEATGKILGAPAVANADINNPNSWLNQFMSEAEQKNLRVDFIPLHWYGSSSDVSQDVDQLKNYVQSVEDKFHKPIWVTEMNLWNFSGGPEPTHEQQVQFTNEASKMLDSLPYVQRYAEGQGS